MKRISSLIGAVLIALCLEVGAVVLIDHWWGTAAAIAVIAIECVFFLWTVYEIRRASDEPDNE